MKKTLTLITSFGILANAYAQNKTYFTTAIKADVSFKTTKSALLSTGGFLITGQKGDNFEQHQQAKIILKTDSNGNILWQRSFNAPKNMGDAIAASIPSGGFLVTAPTINGDNVETIIFKTDDAGAVISTKLLSDPSTQAELSEILPTTNNGTIYIGMAKGSFKNVDNAMDIYITRQDEAFKVIWSKLYSISDKEFYTASAMLKDGTILTGGLATSCGQGCISKAYVMTVNPENGDHIKTRMFNSTSYTIDNLIAAADGGFFAVVNDQGKETYNLVKFTKNMDVVYAKEYTSTVRLQLINVNELPSGELILAGYSDLGYSVIKLDAKGQVITAKNYFSRFSFSKINLFARKNNLITAVVNDYNQTTVFNFGTDGYTACMDSISAFEVTTADLQMDFYTNTSPVFYNKPNMENGPEFKDYAFTNEPSTDITVSSKVICKTTVSAVKETAETAAISIYPNPSKGTINVDVSEIKSGSAFSLYNVYGELVYSAALTARHTVLDLSTNASGIYFATIKNGTKVITNKIVVQ